jgi:hypothetical protein
LRSLAEQTPTRYSLIIEAWCAHVVNVTGTTHTFVDLDPKFTYKVSALSVSEGETTTYSSISAPVTVATLLTPPDQRTWGGFLLVLPLS